MNKYRKKPVVVEAVRVDRLNALDVAGWCGGTAVAPRATEYMHGNKVLYIDTLEGRMYADAEDWIIRGVQGEFYPCKPDIFEATYEAVTA